METVFIILSAVLLLFVIYIICVAVGFFRIGLTRHPDYDTNYDPVRDKERSAPDHGTEYRIRAWEYNKWWNTRKLEYREITSDDGLKLVASVLKSDTPSDTVVLVVHGHLCCAGEEGFASKMFHEAGFDVWAPDQRAHGKSGGRFITMGSREGMDVKRWAEEIARERPEVSIVLYGGSMGAASVCMASARELPEQVKCVISDCAYTTAYEVFGVELKNRYSWLPFKKLLLETSNFISVLLTGFNFKKCSVTEKIAQSKRPVMFIQGKSDILVLPEMAQVLYDAHPGEKELMWVEGAGHNVSFFHAPDYRERVLKFISKYVSQD